MPRSATESARRRESAKLSESLRAIAAESGGKTFFSILIPYPAAFPPLGLLFCADEERGSRNIPAASRIENIFSPFFK